IQDERYQEARTMTLTYYDYWVQKGLDEGMKKGMEKGLEEGRDEGLRTGRDEGQRQLLQVQLEQRVGPLSPDIRKRLETWAGENLLQLAKSIVQAQSLRELGLEE